MSDAAKERYIALRAAWQALGQEVEAIRLVEEARVSTPWLADYGACGL